VSAVGVPRITTVRKYESFTAIRPSNVSDYRPQDSSEQVRWEKSGESHVGNKSSRLKILIFTAGNQPEGQQ